MKVHTINCIKILYSCIHIYIYGNMYVRMYYYISIEAQVWSVSTPAFVCHHFLRSMPGETRTVGVVLWTFANRMRMHAHMYVHMYISIHIYLKIYMIALMFHWNWCCLMGATCRHTYVHTTIRIKLKSQSYQH